MKYYLRHENKVNKNKVLYCKALRCEIIKTTNLQAYSHFKLDSQKVDQHTGGKWLIHGTKRCNDNHIDIIVLN